MPSQARVAEIRSVLNSGNTARTLLGNALTLLHSAYQVTGTYNVGPLGSGVTAQNTEYLDGIRLRAESDYAALPASDDLLDSDVAGQVAFDIASIESATNQTITLLGAGTALGDLADSVVDTVKSAASGLAGGLTPPGGWWLWIGVAVFLFIVLKTRK
jgi:hypothetical protein